LLRASDLTFRYADRDVLGGITLGIGRGEMCALIGPNGAGKSTLLNLFAGSLRPGRGEVTLDRRNLRAYSPQERARRIALVPQTVAIPFAFTVREFVTLGRTPHSAALQGERAADRSAVARALALTRTEQFANQSILELSGGERQRVILALALAQEPEVLLLDEPTANLDVAQQIAILRLVADLNRTQALTVVAAMHDLNLAALFFPRLIALAAGHVVADGPPSLVLTPPFIESVFGSRVAVIGHPLEPVPLVALGS
jgi:iron complex transport system ATP-binding protein